MLLKKDILIIEAKIRFCLFFKFLEYGPEYLFQVNWNKERDLIGKSKNFKKIVIFLIK